MYLSQDLLILNQKTDSECVLIYNKYTNTKAFLHKAIYSYLLDNLPLENDKKIYEDLSEYQIEVLINSGIIYMDKNDYLKKKFIKSKLPEEKKIKTVYLHVTLQCNLSCTYCYQRGNLNTRQELHCKDWVYIIDELNKMGVEHLIFTGGEPLLYKRLFDLTKYAKNYGMKVTLLTNGMLFEKVGYDLTGIDQIIISLDGLKSGERKGIDVGKVLTAIKKIKNTDLKNFSVRSVVSRDHENDIMELSSVLKELSVNHIKVMRMPHSKSEIDLMPDYKNECIFENECVKHGCSAGSGIIAVDSNGDVYPCQNLMKKPFIITNILKEDWEAEYYRNNINNTINSFTPEDHDVCKRCDIRSLCYGGCGADIYNVYGVFNKRPAYLCDFYKYSTLEWLKNER